MFYFITIPAWWNKNNKSAYCCLNYIWLSDHPYIFLLIETCDPLAFVMVLANGNQVLNDNAGLCTDGTHSAPEAVVMQTCKAPAPSTWTAGPKVNRRKLPFECISGFTVWTIQAFTCTCIPLICGKGGGGDWHKRTSGSNRSLHCAMVLTAPNATLLRPARESQDRWPLWWCTSFKSLGVGKLRQDSCVHTDRHVWIWSVQSGLLLLVGNLRGVHGWRVQGQCCKPLLGLPKSRHLLYYSQGFLKLMNCEMNNEQHMKTCNIFVRTTLTNL